MARQLKIRRNLRCFLDEESKMVPQVDNEGEDLYIQKLNSEGEKVFDSKDEPVWTDQRVEKEEMVPVVRVIGKEFPEPEEGTIFHLALMRFSDAMRFNNLNGDMRAEALDAFAPKSIKNWERMLDDNDEEVGFQPEYIEFIDTIDRLHLVMCSVMQSLGGAKGKG